MPVNRTVTRRYRQPDGTIVTVTERTGDRSRGSRSANLLLGYQDYKTTTTKTRYPNGTTTTEHSESPPFIAAFFILGLTGVVVEGFNSPDWYWVLTSAVVSLVVVSLVVLFVAYYVKRVAAHLKRRSYR